MYYAEHKEYTADQDELGVDGEGNKYFTTYTVTEADTDGFEVETTGTGVASNIKVTLTYTTAGGADDLVYDFNVE